MYSINIAVSANTATDTATMDAVFSDRVIYNGRELAIQDGNAVYMDEYRICPRKSSAYTLW